MDEHPAATIRLDLTVEQKQIVKAATNRDVDALELSVQELEQRVAPRIAQNNNETLLVETVDTP
jgi:hypothetical protein